MLYIIFLNLIINCALRISRFFYTANKLKSLNSFPPLDCWEEDMGSVNVSLRFEPDKSFASWINAQYFPIYIMNGNQKRHLCQYYIFRFFSLAFTSWHTHPFGLNELCTPPGQCMTTRCHLSLRKLSTSDF